MVIPIGGGGGMPAMQMAEIPGELRPRFAKIKLCLLVLIASLLVKIVAGGVLQPNSIFFWIYSSLNPILNVVIGIFLLKDDNLFGRVHNCCITTICGSCQEQCPCPGGMPCLCSWFFCTTLTALLSIIPFPQSDMSYLIIGFKALNSPSTWGGGVEWVVAYSFFLAGTLFALVAQIIGAYQGFMAFKRANDIASGDDYAGGMAGAYGDPYGGRGGGGDGGGSGGGRYVGAGGQVQTTAPGASRAPAQNSMSWQPFTGSGQRLGG